MALPKTKGINVMQIALTKKLATAMGVKPCAADESANPLFCWAANWINTFENCQEDMIVMVNRATRFTVTIYGVKRGLFKDIQAKMIAAIHHTLLSMNLDPELVEEYVCLASDIAYTANRDRKMTSQLYHQGLDAAFVAGRAVNESGGRLKFEDTLGRAVSRRLVNYSTRSEDAFIPAREMAKSLCELTGKPPYKYRAFELLVTLDLDIYKATRRLIVAADIDFQRLHLVLQQAFGWRNYHLYEFTVWDDAGKPCARLVPDEESLSYGDDAVLMDGHKLSEFLPRYNRILYTYDMGDDWEHQIELVRVIDEHNEDSPYLLEANGQTPPEDVGGVDGFIDFRKIMLDPDHPEHAATKEWAGYWSAELKEWAARPRVID